MFKFNVGDRVEYEHQLLSGEKIKKKYIVLLVKYYSDVNQEILRLGSDNAFFVVDSSKCSSSP